MLPGRCKRWNPIAARYLVGPRVGRGPGPPRSGERPLWPEQLHEPLAGGADECHRLVLAATLRRVSSSGKTIPASLYPLLEVPPLRSITGQHPSLPKVLSRRAVPPAPELQLPERRWVERIIV